jgi:hypothetical protein
MNNLTQYYVLSTSFDETFFAVFTQEEYNMMAECRYSIEWAGLADSSISAATCWVDQKDFTAISKVDFLESFI